jgi:hypothetical protein
MARHIELSTTRRAWVITALLFQSGALGCRVNEEGHVEVKIGVQFAPRELVLESAQTPAEVEKIVTEAISSDESVLSLVDERGRRVIVPVSKIAYVEIAEAVTRTVGFTAS